MDVFISMFYISVYILIFPIVIKLYPLPSPSCTQIWKKNWSQKLVPLTPAIPISKTWCNTDNLACERGNTECERLPLWTCVNFRLFIKNLCLDLLFNTYALYEKYNLCTMCKIACLFCWEMHACFLTLICLSICKKMTIIFFAPSVGACNQCYHLHTSCTWWFWTVSCGSHVLKYSWLLESDSKITRVTWGLATLTPLLHNLHHHPFLVSNFEWQSRS